MTHIPNAADDTFGHLIRRIRAEFLEMPGTRLTVSQAARLWHLEVATARSLLTALVDARFLARTPAGAYHRAESR